MEAMDLSKCGGVCKSDCRHYAIGLACPTEAVYAPRPQERKGKLDIGRSPISNKIFIGGVLKDGGWAANKTDVTGKACASVATYVLECGGDVTVSVNGKPTYEISVKALD